MEYQKRIVDLGEVYGKVLLDPANFEFNPDTLSVYLEKEAGWYDYYGQKVADAEYLAQLAEEAYELKYSAVYRIEKGEGATDKLAEARAKSEPDVAKAKQDWLLAKHHVSLLKQHLRSWDRSHDNAQNRGHTLRKESAYLPGGTIYNPPGENTGKWSNYRQDDILQRQQEAQLDSIIKPVDPNKLEGLPK